ncbi:MAG TPA: hypothetical protein VHH90_08720 [Polyangia bacterium]|nr:hypothetical protein [Polyangia bacterium]
MTRVDNLNRLDANNIRLASAAFGVVLGVLWIVGLAARASFWLTWMTALAALACFGTVALVPERRAGFVAAGNLAFVALGLGACWIVSLATGGTAWLAWSCLALAGLVLVGAVGAALAAALDHFR